MSDLTRAQVRKLLEIQGYDPPEPDFTEVAWRINAVIDALKLLDGLDVFHVEPWSVMPFRGLPQREPGPANPQTDRSPHTDDLLFMTISEQAALIRSKELSPVDLVSRTLEQIARLDPKLHAFNLVDADRAMADARISAAKIAAGEYEGPLHGMPLGIKDQFDVAGWPNTGGSAAYADNMAAEDCTIVERLRTAGAVMVGTLATHEFHMGGTLRFFAGESPRNPWDLTRTPAGSSSGSGSAVAAGMLGGSFGGDTGGSIRGPGSVNGIVGLRPSWSRLSRQGAFALSWSMDTAGPLARSVEDAALLLQATAGYDPKDRTTSREPVPDYSLFLTGNVKGLRVGVLEEMMSDAVEVETREVVREAIDVLKSLGARVEPLSIPLIERMAGLQSGISDANAASYHRGHLRTHYDLYDYNTRVRVMVGSIIPSGLQTLAMRARAKMAETILDAFEDFDIIVGATGTGPAGPIVTQSPVTSRAEATRAVMTRGGGSNAFSMAGAAAMSIPAGFTHSGLPVGMHVAARPLDEGTLFRLGDAFQRETDHHRKHPPMTWAMEGAAPTAV